jgi:glycosyltransferase involved in cell wall biosynthesis
VSTASTVHVVVPEGVADPLRPSGGNTYDRRLCEALGTAGWSVCVAEVAGPWPSRRGEEALEATLRTLPDGSLVLVDGLVASRLPTVVVPACRRLRLVVLLHMPFGAEAEPGDSLAAECEVLRAAPSVVTPSAWCRSWLLTAYGLDPGKVHVAQPGADVAAPATGSEGGEGLLSVGAVTPVKGHDLLLLALAQVAELRWRCRCVGAQSVAPRFVARLRSNAGDHGLDNRFLLTGPRTGRELDAAYAEADVLVLPSRLETFGMVVTEALARGLPVIAADVGGVPEALGATVEGVRPGLLVPPGDARALSEALRRWLTDAGLRGALRRAALQRRTGLTTWSETADRVGRVLSEVAS